MVGGKITQQKEKENNKMKKSFLLVLLLMICSLALFGCKDKNLQLKVIQMTVETHQVK
jgi:hypothetical protein